MKSFALKLVVVFFALLLALLGVLEVQATAGLDPEPIPTPLYTPLEEWSVENFCRWEVSNGVPVSDPHTSELRCENSGGESVPLDLDEVCRFTWGQAWPFAVDARQGLICASRAYIARQTRNR